MGDRFDRLPKGVQKLVKRLANIEREELKTLRAGYPDEEARMMKLIEKGDKVTEELFDTRFALEELGVCYPESPDDLQEMGEYFLGLYALDRAYAEEDGKEYSEDLFYAGANLKQAADILADAEYDDELDDELIRVRKKKPPKGSKKKGKKKKKGGFMKVLPILIAVILIIAVGGAFYGQKLMEKYSYGTERADLSEYFHNDLKRTLRRRRYVRENGARPEHSGSHPFPPPFRTRLFRQGYVRTPAFPGKARQPAGIP